MLERQTDGATIRTARQDDLPDLVDLYRQLTGGAPVADGAKGHARLAEILCHPGTTVFGAEIAGRLASVATLHICPNLTFGGRSFALIENVVTDADLRRQGLARHVLQAAIHEAWAEDCCSVILLTGKELGARGLYEGLGFNAGEKWGMVLRPAGASMT